jgi:hypothetical protein
MKQTARSIPQAGRVREDVRFLHPIPRGLPTEGPYGLNMDRDDRCGRDEQIKSPGLNQAILFAQTTDSRYGTTSRFTSPTPP